MAQQVLCHHKFKLGISNFLGLHQLVISLCYIFLIFFLSLYPDVGVLVNVCMQEIKTEMNPVLNPRSAGPEGSLIGIPGILQLIDLPFICD